MGAPGGCQGGEGRLVAGNLPCADVKAGGCAHPAHPAHPKRKQVNACASAGCNSRKKQSTRTAEARGPAQLIWQRARPVRLWTPLPAVSGIIMAFWLSPGHISNCPRATTPVAAATSCRSCPSAATSRRIPSMTSWQSTPGSSGFTGQSLDVRYAPSTFRPTQRHRLVTRMASKGAVGAAAAQVVTLGTCLT